MIYFLGESSYTGAIVAGRRLFHQLPSRIELEIVRAIDTPQAIHIRYRVRRRGKRIMEYRGLVKSLVLPSGHAPPRELAYGEIRARALSRADLVADVAAINASLELIQRTRGGGWPTQAVSEDFNYVDLVWHECEFREGYSFAYAVYDADGGYIGCCYLYPMGRRTPLTEELLKHDVDVSWWVTAEAYERGLYAKLYLALQRWLAESFPFGMPYYSNLEIPDRSGA